MKVCFQDPFLAEYNLHEEILLASIGATEGAEVFAFVTSGGVNLLLMDECFIEFIQQNTFTLVIGTDEITNTETIKTLCGYAEQYRNLRVKAFLNPLSNATFHPKYCWFKHGHGGQAVIGSGNLTQQGLRKNWEAFSVLDMAATEFSRLEAQWNRWFVKNLPHLKDITDPSVTTKVAQNCRVPRRSANIQAATKRGVSEDFQAWTYDEQAEVLLAEIPKASNRWNQVNFDKESFEGFFGARAGDNTMRVLFKGVDDKGVEQEVESRVSVSVQSRNWRFELNLAKDKRYPENGRPIGIFVKVSERNFLYMLSMPDYRHHASIAGLLPDNEQRGLRRCRKQVASVREACPKLPLWKYIKRPAAT